MSVHEAIAIVRNELRRCGSDIELKVAKGTWTVPSTVQFTAHGADHLLQFWEGGYPDKKIAELVLIDVMAAVWGLPEAEAKARLENERA